MQFAVPKRTRCGGPAAPDERSSPSGTFRRDVREKWRLTKTAYLNWLSLDSHAASHISVGGDRDRRYRITGIPDSRRGIDGGPDVYQVVRGANDDQHTINRVVESRWVDAFVECNGLRARASS